MSEPSVEESQQKVEEIIEKYDVESRYRKLSGLSGLFVSGWLVAMSAFHFYTAGLSTLPTSIHRAVHLTFAMVAVFLLYPARKSSSRRSIPWYDWLLAGLSALGCGYIVFFFNDIARRGAAVFPHDLWLGIMTIVLILEAGRRGGYTIFS